MRYTLISPPFTLPFEFMPKSMLKGYFQWFMDNMPLRMTELENAIKETIGFETWKADFSVASLAILGMWFVEQIGTRPYSADEVKKLRLSLTSDIEAPNRDITDKTYSLSFDIGFYFARVLQNENSALIWEQVLKNKRHVDYGQPVLVGFRSGVSLNPVSAIEVLARRTLDKKAFSDGLSNLYNVWSEL